MDYKRQPNYLKTEINHTVVFRQNNIVSRRCMEAHEHLEAHREQESMNQLHLMETSKCRFQQAHSYRETRHYSHPATQPTQLRRSSQDKAQRDNARAAQSRECLMLEGTKGYQKKPPGRGGVKRSPGQPER